MFICSDQLHVLQRMFIELHFYSKLLFCTFFAWFAFYVPSLHFILNIFSAVFTKYM